MGDGSDFNSESGGPRKTSFGVEARFFDEQSGLSRAAQDFVMSDFSLILVLQNQNKQNHQ